MVTASRRNLTLTSLRSGFEPRSVQERSRPRGRPDCEKKKESMNAFYQNRTSDLIMSNRSLNLLVMRYTT